MHFLYNLGIRSYGLILFLAQFFVPKAKKWIGGRLHFWENLPDISGKHVVWFHCASLGEFDQGLPLMNRIKTENPSVYLLVTFFSPSGMEHYHKRNHLADFVCYLPLDTPKNARKFIQYFSPKEIFFVKYEFWGNYILAGKKAGATVYSVSAIFRSNHRFFKRQGTFFRKILRQFDAFFVQTELSVQLLQSIGIQKVHFVGDTRFDRVIENKNNAQPDYILAQFTAEKKAWIIGSSWSVDESFLEQLIQKQAEELPVILVPHDISETHLREIEKRFGENLIRYSNWKSHSTARILLIDSIGKLANAYQYGKIAYVGGGFSGSLHNILEPAVFGLPVIFGPKHSRFPEAEVFIQAGIGFSVSNIEELEKTWSFILENIDSITQKARVEVSKSAGATERILEKINLRVE